MTTSAAPVTFGVTTRIARSRLAPATARAIGLGALSLGITADVLVREGVSGAAFPLFVALVALTLTAVVRRDGRTVAGESLAWLLAACVLACGVAWRNAELLAGFDWVGAQACLLMSAIRLRDPRAGLFAPRIRRTVLAVAILARDVALGLLPLAFTDLRAAGDAAPIRSRARRVLRPALFALVVVAVFLPLLRGADPLFASFVSFPDIAIDELVRHGVIVAVFAWGVGGWARSALLPTGERRVFTYGVSLSRAEVSAILGTLNALFALFVLAQLGWIFGGERFLREHTGLTAAAYARQGFFQLCWIAALVVPVLLVTRGALLPGCALRRRHTLLALPAIALLAAMIGSAALRMKLYVHYYGLTVDRLYPMVFMGWLAVVLGWMSITVLRDRGRRFVAGAAGSGLLTLAALNGADPDAIVARMRVSPDAVAAPDVAYLSRLGGGAVPIATRATLREPDAAAACEAANTLLRRWGPGSRAERALRTAGGWRAWNADDARAVAAVRAETAALMRTVRERCAGPHAARWSYR